MKRYKQLKTFLFCQLFVIVIKSIIYGQLQIMSFQPLYLNLTFNQTLKLPQFQLLFNQIPIKYQIISTQQKSYIINGITNGIVNPTDYITQKYVIMFIQPLNIPGQTLKLNSFLIRAKQNRNKTQYITKPIKIKPSPYYFQNQSDSINILAIFICSMVYVLAYTTQIGRSAILFLGICTYISLRSTLFTALDYKIAFYLLFNNHQLKNNQLYQILYLFIPHFLIILSIIISGISRFALKQKAERSGLCNFIYYYLCYKVTIITWDIMFLPIFVNTAHIIRQFYKDDYLLNQQISALYIYFNILILMFYMYMTYMATNPQIGQSQQKWLQYTKTDHFQLFSGFHFGVDYTKKFNRLYAIIISTFRVILLLALSISASSSMIVNLILQCIYVSYVMLAHPFRYNFFNYFNIFIRFLIISYYLYRYILQVYVKISEQITTSTDFSRLLLTNIIIQSIIIVIFLILGVYQLYQRIRVLRINLRTWKMEYKNEENYNNRKTKKSIFNQENEQNKYQNKQNKQNKQRKSIKQLNNKIKNKYLTQLKIQQNQQKKILQNKNQLNQQKLQKKRRSNKKLKPKSSLLQSMSLQLQQQEENNLK